MTVKSAALTVLLLAAILLVAGCTSPSNGTPTTTPTTATPVSTTVPTTAPPTTTTVSITPGPTDAMPENLQAEFQVDPKDPIYANVRVAYRGGTATIHITHIDVILTRADGTVIRKTLPESGTRKVQVGDEIIMQGTRQTDRLQVTVSLDNGNTYRVIDQLLPYQTRP